MKRTIYLINLFIFSSCLCAAQEADILIDFSGDTAEENNVSLMGPGFGSIPQADVTFGDIPTENAFEGATDGIGAKIEAEPGEGIMILGPVVETEKIALIRCAVQVSSTDANVGIATVGQGPDEYVATNIPNNSDSFYNQYERISIFFIPPSSGFHPLV